MAVFARQNAGTTWCANGIHDEATVETHPLAGDAVHVWRFVHHTAVTTHRVRRVVIGHDEKDVRMQPGRTLGDGGGENEGSHQHADQTDF